MVVKIVSKKCGITGCDLFNQPTFTTVFNNFIHWIETCVIEARQSGIPDFDHDLLLTVSIVTTLLIV